MSYQAFDIKKQVIIIIINIVKDIINIYYIFIG